MTVAASPDFTGAKPAPAVFVPHGAGPFPILVAMGDAGTAPVLLLKAGCSCRQASPAGVLSLLPTAQRTELPLVFAADTSLSVLCFVLQAHTQSSAGVQPSTHRSYAPCASGARSTQSPRQPW